MNPLVPESRVVLRWFPVLLRAPWPRAPASMTECSWSGSRALKKRPVKKTEKRATHSSFYLSPSFSCGWAKGWNVLLVRRLPFREARSFPVSAARFLICSSVGPIYHWPPPQWGRWSPRPARLGGQICASKSRQYLATIRRQSFNWIWYLQRPWDSAPHHLSPPVKALLTISELPCWTELSNIEEPKLKVCLTL